MMYLLGLISLSFYRGPSLALQVRPWARHALADVIRDLADNAGNNLEYELAPPRAFMIVLLATASADVIPVMWDKTVASTWVSWHNGKSSTESASDLIEEEAFLVFWLSYVLHWLWYTQLHQKLKFSLWLPAQDRLKINAVRFIRGMTNSPNCERYNCAQENTQQILTDSPHAWKFGRNIFLFLTLGSWLVKNLRVHGWQ